MIDKYLPPAELPRHNRTRTNPRLKNLSDRYGRLYKELPRLLEQASVPTAADSQRATVMGKVQRLVHMRHKFVSGVGLKPIKSDVLVQTEGFATLTNLKDYAGESLMSDEERAEALAAITQERKQRIEEETRQRQLEDIQDAFWLKFDELLEDERAQKCVDFWDEHNGVPKATFRRQERRAPRTFPEQSFQNANDNVHTTPRIFRTA